MLRVAKYAPRGTVIGDAGVGLIHTTVGLMGHLWHPTSGVDSGIDGEIELRSPSDGQVKNRRIGVQSKATESPWDADDGDSFSFSPTYNDIEYWLSSNHPVIVVCTRPSTGEAYWRSVQEWVRDPQRRAKRTLRFDKQKDRFDQATRDLLFNLNAVDHDDVEPPGPAPEPETLLTNLMPISWQGAEVWSAEIGDLDPPAVFERARLVGATHTGLAFRDGELWSLREFSDAFLGAIDAHAAKRSSLDGWLQSGDVSDLNLIRELVCRDLVDRHSWWLRWHAYKKRAYFRRRGERQAVSYKWGKGTGRGVVLPQYAKAGHFTGYRHDAAGLHVRRFGDALYLQVSPTYLFTWDGKDLSGHHDSALAGINRKDRHASVSQMLRMWATLLADEHTIDGHEHPFALGALVEVRSPQSIPENGWKEVSAEELGQAAAGETMPQLDSPEDDDLRLFDATEQAA